MVPMKSNKAIVKVMPKGKEQEIAPLVTQMLERLGEDPTRNGLLRTPQPVPPSTCSQWMRLL